MLEPDNDHCPSSKSNSNFHHIYFDDWQHGSVYERKTKDGVISMGKLVEKKLSGRTYDPDMLLTFERVDGTKYKHTVAFDSSYRLANTTN